MRSLDFMECYQLGEACRGAAGAFGEKQAPGSLWHVISLAISSWLLPAIPFAKRDVPKLYGME